MTVNRDELKKLILAADRQALCDTLAPLDENHRAELYPDALHLYRIVEKGSFLEKNDKEPIGLEHESWFDAGFLAKLRKKTYSDWRCPRWTGSLMMLAVADEKFLRNPYKFDAGWVASDLRDMPQRVLEVLNARRPKWLASFVKREAKQENTFIAWSVEYGLIGSGAVPENNSEDFYRRMALYPMTSESYASDAVKHDSLPPKPNTLADALRAQPAMLKTHIWNLFEYDAGAFNYSHSPWFDACKTLSDDGVIDRKRLLAVSASALSRPSRPKELVGYGKLHETLDPTIEEREDNVPHYLTALNSEHAGVVGCAIAALEKMAKAKKLDSFELLQHIDGALRVPQKSQPSKAIKLIQMLVKQQPDAAGLATEALAIAVSHERPDVQEAGIKGLEALKESFSELTRERLSEAESLVASVLKSRVTGLATASTKTTSTEAANNSPKQKVSKKKTIRGKDASQSRKRASEADAELASLKARLAKVPSEIREASEAGRAIEELSTGAETTPFVAMIPPAKVPRRDPEKCIEPIGSLEELIDTVAAVIERVDDAMDIERIVDGISRLGQQQPDDFNQRVAPLRKRIEKLDEPYSQSVIDLGAQIGFSQLLADWLGMDMIRRHHNTWRDLDGMLFRLRCQEISEHRRMKREPSCRLALPTHQDGWLDPVVLVERLRTDFVERRTCIGDADLTQALLRLTPDGRTEACARIEGFPETRVTGGLYDGGPSLKYALGEDPSFRNERPYPWVQGKNLAATHARIFVEGPDFETQFPVATASTNEDFTIRVDGPFVEDPSLPVRLCVLANSLANDGLPPLRSATWVQHLEAMTWPANRQPMLMLGYLDGVFDQDSTWTGEAARLVVRASFAEAKELRMQATDALIEAVDQVSVYPKMIGEQMFRLGEHLTLKRTADVLASVGQVSALHQSVVFYAIDEYIGRLQLVPRDLHCALTPMLEAALQCGAVLSEQAATVLRTIKGSSKAAKLAQQLLAVEANPQKRLATQLQAATAAVERSERWARIVSTETV